MFEVHKSDVHSNIFWNTILGPNKKNEHVLTVITQPRAPHNFLENLNLFSCKH